MHARKYIENYGIWFEISMGFSQGWLSMTRPMLSSNLSTTPQQHIFFLLPKLSRLMMMILMYMLLEQGCLCTADRITTLGTNNLIVLSSSLTARFPKNVPGPKCIKYNLQNGSAIEQNILRDLGNKSRLDLPSSGLNDQTLPNFRDFFLFLLLFSLEDLAGL
ncbi:hypothetical protein PHYBLDRAFT_141678 [Phycomyces blakesleeanus NRRL 1555(-)]|uniref:Uncharacterized protein n=1 Tax=Phycomyces blakesleeanus (strain ATCC 8743b / DSM 1359 / FGSC 10004 / NBRC 33097 / NRRL 1555) TaxID=763407 RepID=A0A167PFK0_PHYB8|nr:hypothetical protein PHYBLDRAFT_141678 [Phycomyces blakesleeanus NRRL 1555(-)]OAD77817.1 hypothetical protein PHYBLDRAFT_141678 [Phycomyces blakesleeanus NRRL 1555(-)]|eukprot:XP_018295857.1 hypothetical protein PHYBLDRAFT_141678 [Phycomyces blakesleeanus NRRL 1555(-)]